MRPKGFLEDPLNEVRLKSSSGQLASKTSVLYATSSGLGVLRKHEASARFILLRALHMRCRRSNGRLAKPLRGQFRPNHGPCIPTPRPVLSPQSGARVIIDEPTSLAEGDGASDIGAWHAGTLKVDLQFLRRPNPPANIPHGLSRCG